MRWSELLALAAALTAASCNITDPAGPKPSEPASVARVTVSPDSTVVQVGQSVRLNAAVLDEGGRAINGKTVDWFSYDATIAAVDNTGNVTGIKAGSATITASVDGKRGSARVNVGYAANAIVITSIAPSTLVEGKAATITGQNFGASSSRVLVDGEPAYVMSWTPSSIDFIAPNSGCKPQHMVNVQVQLLNAASNIVKTLIRPVGTLNMQVGQQEIIANPQYFCLQFAASNAAEAYLIGVQSVTENAALATQAVVTSAGAPSGNTTEPILEPLTVQSNFRRFAVPPASLLADETRRRGQLVAESRALGSERALLQQMRARGLSPAASSVSAPSVPAGARVGDVLTMRVSSFLGEPCSRYTSFNAVVRFITPHAILVEDVANPAGGFSQAQLQSMINFFETYAYDTDVGYFGPPSDIDGNGRVVLVFTKEVNKESAKESADFDLAAFVKAANWFTQSYCASSNEGEVIYFAAADPSGIVGRPTRPPAQYMNELLGLAPHEFTHVLQLSTQILNNLASPPTWVTEGQATFAEEAMGHRMLGHAPGNNYGFDVAYATQTSGSVDYYRAISWMSWWYGYAGIGSTTRVATAPEACSWTMPSWEGANIPCPHVDNLMYAYAFTFLRWLSDQFGPTYQGGEKALQRALVRANSTSGFTMVSRTVNVPIDSLLAQFTAALYVDDRVPNAPRRLTMPSWNLYDIEANKNSLQRLTPHERSFGVYSDPVTVRGGSLAYFRVSGNGHPATGIKVLDPNGNVLPSHMRLWVVRLQ